jgi:hypothetical protein
MGPILASDKKVESRKETGQSGCQPSNCLRRGNALCLIYFLLTPALPSITAYGNGPDTIRTYDLVLIGGPWKLRNFQRFASPLSLSRTEGRTRILRVTMSYTGIEIIKILQQYGSLHIGSGPGNCLQIGASQEMLVREVTIYGVSIGQDRYLKANR